MPWIGYFLKVAACDIFIIHDKVQHTKSGLTRRVKIASLKGKDHVQWLTVPLKKHSDFAIIEKLEIDWSSDWTAKHLNIIYDTYHACPYFSECYSYLKRYFMEAKSFTFLSDLNIRFVKDLCDLLEIRSSFENSSNLHFEAAKTELNISIIKAVNGRHYISGMGAKKYQDDHLYIDNEIELTYLDSITILRNNPYHQMVITPDFGVSIIDMWMNVGLDGIKSFIAEHGKR